MKALIKKFSRSKVFTYPVAKLRLDRSILKRTVLLGLATLYPFAVTSGVSAIFLVSNSGYQERVFVALVYSLIFNSIVIGCLISVSSYFIRVIFLAIIWLYLSIFTVLSVAHILIYGQLFGLPSLAAIDDTNLRETYEFLRSLSLATVGISLASLLPVLILAIMSYRLIKTVSAGSKSLVLFCVLAIIVGDIGFRQAFISQQNTFLFAGWLLKEAMPATVTSRNLSMHRMSSEEHVSFSRPSISPVTHVLILGESTTSRRMSLFGYRRRTNPLLESSRSNVFIDEDACSSRGATVPSLSEIFSFADRDHPNLFNEQPNLLQIMKSAQYKVFWISNQQAVGSSDSWVGELSRTADVREFLNRRGWTDGISLDNNLLPKLKDALFDGADRKFIVLHLLGTHAAYDLRFPPEFRAFRTNDGLDGKILEKRGLLDNLFRGSRIELSNAYDNAVLYNDTVVSKIIQMIRASETNYSIVYLSDHGEALGEDGRFVGHIDDVAPKQVYQIPLMFVLSDSVIGSLGEESFRSFKENLNLKFETNGMIHTMLDLYGLSYAYLRSEKSLLSRDYKPWPRFCDGLK